MATPLYDQLQNLSPKPLDFYNKKQVNGVFVDWDSISEIQNSPLVPASFLPNKEFYIAGVLYRTDSSGNFSVVNPVTATSIGLGNVDNTHDIDKPVSTAQSLAINSAVKINGYPSKTIFHIDDVVGIMDGSGTILYRSTIQQLVQNSGVVFTGNIYGVATTSTIPSGGTPTAQVVYIAGPGTYNNFPLVGGGNMVLTENLNFVAWDGTHATFQPVPIDLTNVVQIQNGLVATMGLSDNFSFTGSGTSWVASANAGAFSAILPNGIIVSNNVSFNLTLPNTVGRLIIDTSGNVTIGDPDNTHFILATFFTPNKIFHVNGLYNVNGLPFGNDSNLKSISADGTKFTIYSSGSTWNAKSSANAIALLLKDGTTLYNKAFDLPLIAGVYSNIVIDSSGNVSILGDSAVPNMSFRIMRCYPPTNIFSSLCPYNVNGIFLNNVPKTLKSCVSSPAFFRFYQVSVGGTWNVASVAAGMNFSFFDETHVSNAAFDLPLLVSGYSNIVTDKLGNVSVLADNADFTGLYLIARCVATSLIFYCNCPYSVNGKAYNIYSELLQSVTTKPENFNFYFDGSIWKTSAVAASINFSFNDGSHIGNKVFDLPLIVGGYSNVVTDILGNVSVVADGSIASSQYLIARVFPSANLFYVKGGYNVNGVAYNLTALPSNYNISIDTPNFTNTICFTGNRPTPFFKNGLFKSMAGDRKVNVVLETILGDSYKRYSIENPTYLQASDIGTSTRLVVEDNSVGQIIYKDITKVIKSVTTGHGATLKWLSLGDSLQQGNLSVLVSPLALMMARLSGYGITVTPIGTFDMDDSRGVAPGIYYGEGRGFWSYKSFVGKVSQVYGTPITIATGTGFTTKFANPFLRLATSTDKANHPDWCFTNTTANPSDPDGISYSTNPSYTNYYIFDFSYYLTQRSLTHPDIITIALGINDWQQTGIINGVDELLSLTILYTQIRTALPTVKIMIVPNNGVLPSDEMQWEQEMQPLQERIITFLENTQTTDSNLFICPIFQHVDRWNAYGVLSSTPLSATNNMQVGTVSNVHVLDKITSQIEYIEAFESTFLTAMGI